MRAVRLTSYGGPEALELNAAVAGFWLRPLRATPDRIAEPLAQLFDYVREGSLRPHVGRVYPLQAVREAHADLEERRSVGKCCSLLKGATPRSEPAGYEAGSSGRRWRRGTA